MKIDDQMNVEEENYNVHGITRGRRIAQNESWTSQKLFYLVM